MAKIQNRRSYRSQANAKRRCTNLSCSDLGISKLRTLELAKFYHTGIRRFSSLIIPAAHGVQRKEKPGVADLRQRPGEKLKNSLTVLRTQFYLQTELLLARMSSSSVQR